MNRLLSFAFCSALLGGPVVCQSIDPGRSVPRDTALQLELRIDRAIVPPGQSSTLEIRGEHPGAPFVVLASDGPVTAGSLAAAAEPAVNAVVVSTGRLDDCGDAAVTLYEPKPGGRWHYTALAFAATTAPGVLHCSAPKSVLWLGGSGQAGLDSPPTVTYSTQFGSAGTQTSRFMTTDENGYIYLAAQVGPLVNPPGDQDPTGGTWIAKLDPSQNGPNGDLSIEWTTTFGGSSEGMNRHDIVAGGGHVFVCGWAIRNDLALGNVFDTTKNIWRDGYVAMFDAGTGLRLATTYLSQQSSSVMGEDTKPWAMALVGDDLYVAGWANHDGLWTTNGFDSTFDGGSDAFLMKLRVVAPDGLDLVWSTYLPGGAGADRARSILVDGLGSVYVAGETDSNLVLPSGGFQSVLGGNLDAFCLRILDGASPALSAGTYLGGSKADDAVAVSLDPSGDVWLGGTTRSTDFPVSAGAFDVELSGRLDAFVARLSPDLSNLVLSSYFGGSGEDSGQGLVAHDSLVYLVGQTRSSDLPLVDPVPGFESKAGREDAFLARLDATGQPVTSTYYGGKSTESANAGLEVDAAGTAWFGGQMDSDDVPLTSPTSYGGDFYVAGFAFAPPPPPPAEPSSLAATAVSSSAIDLTWVDNSSNESGFRIERSLDAIEWNAVGTVGENVTSHTDSGLAASTTYSYRVVAFNSGGDSLPSNVDSATTFAAPANPTITSIDPNSMTAGSSNVPAVITGSGFQSGAVVSFESGQGPAPTPSNVVVTSSTEITLELSVGSGGPPGNRPWDVVVTNPDQGSVTLIGGFTVIK